MMLAPGASRGGSAMRLPGANDARGIDDHLVEPETTRAEVVRGQLMEALPALVPHGDMHVRIIHAIEASVTSDFVASADLLTRFGPDSDFATDVCVRRRGIDPKTGDRFLEEVCFEVVYTQSMSDITRRAEDVIACGVRRIFAIAVKAIGSGDKALLDERATEVLEWSPGEHRWMPLAPDAHIDDACFAYPLAVEALVNAAVTDDHVIRALRAKGNRVLNEIRAEDRRDGRAEGFRDGRAEGFRDGRAEGLRDGVRNGRNEAAEQLQQTIARRLERLCSPLTPSQQARLSACLDLDTLNGWIECLLDGDIPAELAPEK